MPISPSPRFQFTFLLLHGAIKNIFNFLTHYGTAQHLAILVQRVGCLPLDMFIRRQWSSVNETIFCVILSLPQDQLKHSVEFCSVVQHFHGIFPWLSVRNITSYFYLLLLVLIQVRPTWKPLPLSNYVYKQKESDLSLEKVFGKFLFADDNQMTVHLHLCNE